MKKRKFSQIGSLWGLVLILLFAAAPIASSQPDPPREEESQQKPVLVGRISHVEGQLLRYIPSEKDWVATREDAPFGLDDALYSNEKGKAEFIMPNNTWVRIDGDTQIQMIRLEEDLTEMDLASGTARFYNKSSTGLIKATIPFGYVVAGPQTTFDLCVGDKSAEVIALNGKVDFVHPSGEANMKWRPDPPPSWQISSKSPRAREDRMRNGMNGIPPDKAYGRSGCKHPDLRKNIFPPASRTRHGPWRRAAHGRESIMRVPIATSGVPFMSHLVGRRSPWVGGPIGTAINAGFRTSRSAT